MPAAVWWVGDTAGCRSAGAVGFAVLSPQPEAVAATTPFDLASLTKPLATAMLAVLLERDGLLELEAPASHLLPELRGTAYGDVTPVELAAHRAGLAAWKPLYARAADRAGYLARIAAEPLAGPRGVTLYSDLGYLLLGFVLERAGGDTLDRLFDARIAGPLGLRATGYAGAGARFGYAAATEDGNFYERDLAGADGLGHRFREHVPRGQVHDGNAWGLGGVAGHAGLFGPAREVAIVASAILEPEDRLRRDVPTWRFFRRVAGEGSRTFGWLPARDSAAAAGVLSDAAVGHDGFTGTSVWLDPERGRVFVLLTNRVHPRVPAEDFTPIRRGFLAAALSAEIWGGAR